MQVSLKFAPKSIRCMWKNSEMLKRRAVAMMDVLDLHDWNLTIWLVDNDKSRTLNRRHRGKDRSTDVLSFPRHTNLYVPGRLQSRGPRDLGRLVISIPYVHAYCETERECFEERMHVLLAHGICHLLGYDHETDKDYETMQKEETRILDLTNKEEYHFHHVPPSDNNV